MNIGSIGAAAYRANNPSPKRESGVNSNPAPAKRDKFQKSDSYTSSNGDIQVRAGSLDEVKSRVKDGYYQNEVVNEDLADIFTKLLSKTI